MSRDKVIPRERMSGEFARISSRVGKRGQDPPTSGPEAVKSRSRLLQCRPRVASGMAERITQLGLIRLAQAIITCSRGTSVLIPSSSTLFADDLMRPRQPTVITLDVAAESFDYRRQLVCML
jgi:hypothetical protein